MTKEKIYIIDAVNYLFRSYYAIGPMTNDQGESTNALFGFIRSIKKLQKDFSPKYLCAVFDGPENKQPRQEVFADYKMHRKGAPEDLYPQFSRAFEWCEMSGIPALCIPRVEADDTMASIAVWAEKKGLTVYLCTTDKDLYQLVGKNIFVLNIHKDNLIIDAKKVKELFGVMPEQMLDFLSITGDKSDNIPGIRGFGPKIAAELLQQMPTLEEILAHPEKLKGKKQEILKKEKDKAILSKKVATLNIKVDIPTKLTFYEVKEENAEDLGALYHEMKFMKLLEKLQPYIEEEKEEPKKKPKKEKKEKRSYHLVNSEKDLEHLLSHLSKQKEICIDTETTSLHPIETRIVGIGFGIHPKEAWYVPFNGDISPEIIVEALHALFSTKNISFYGHNLKFDFHALCNHGILIESIAFDTILASYLLNPQKRLHGLDRLALEYFDHTKIPIESLIPSKKKKVIAMEKVPLEKIAEYCCEDVDYCCRLKDIFEKELEKRKLDSVLYDIELPLIFSLVKMERHGMYIDVKKFESLSEEFSQELEKRAKEIYKDVGSTFNLNSPRQLGEILYKKLGLSPTRRRRRATEFSTAADVLEKLAHESPIVEKILNYRTLQKLYSTYVEALPKQICKDTDRIHATFMQSITATGRLSCQDPNLQNIPIRGKEGKEIREAFKPQEKGWSYINADYSQIELRLLAHFSEDPELISAFKKGEDIHSYTASLVFNVPQKEVTPKMRQTAKAVNFATIYGQGPYALGQQIGISTRKASEFIETYFERYKKVADFLDHCKKIVAKTGIAITLFGRQRPIPEIHNKNPQIKAAAERLAINTPLQGTGADLIKLSMIEIDSEIKKHNLQGFMVLQIHDELIFEIPDEEIPIFKKIVKEKMENIIKLKVPLVVDIAVGKNWGEC